MLLKPLGHLSATQGNPAILAETQKGRIGSTTWPRSAAHERTAQNNEHPAGKGQSPRSQEKSSELTAQTAGFGITRSRAPEPEKRTLIFEAGVDTVALRRVSSKLVRKCSGRGGAIGNAPAFGLAVN